MTPDRQLESTLRDASDIVTRLVWLAEDAQDEHGRISLDPQSQLIKDAKTVKAAIDYVLALHARRSNERNAD